MIFGKLRSAGVPPAQGPRTSSSAPVRSHMLGLFVLAALVAGCHTDMWVQPKSLPQSESKYFRDGRSTRPSPEGTVAVGETTRSTAFSTGRGTDGKLAPRVPFQVTKEHILRGQERFNIFCAPCHGMLGDGKGMIAQRGLALRRQPANYHTDRLRKVSDGHIFNVITNGFGVMFPYHYRVDVQDRWNIVAYIRALQLSQNQSAGSLSPGELEDLDKPAKPVAPQGGASEH